MKLTVNGRDVSFSSEELAFITERYFEIEQFYNGLFYQVTDRPLEGRWFIVRPRQIGRWMFEEEREDPIQEETRQMILQAIGEVERIPEKYAQSFKTMYPFRSWKQYRPKKISDLDSMAKVLGSHMADETEQALEWAQRIWNGESWEEVCNIPDSAPSYRIITCKDHPFLHRVVGGSREAKSQCGASHINSEKYARYDQIGCSVPLVVSYNVPAI